MKIFIQKVLIIFHKVYKVFVSPFFGNCCRFYPSCSDYTLEAILKYGFFKGTFLATKRILKCNPRHPGGEDFLK